VSCILQDGISTGGVFPSTDLPDGVYLRGSQALANIQCLALSDCRGSGSSKPAVTWTLLSTNCCDKVREGERSASATLRHELSRISATIDDPVPLYAPMTADGIAGMAGACRGAHALLQTTHDRSSMAFESRSLTSQHICSVCRDSQLEARLLSPG
jgi:hypothetical protein